MKPNLKPPNQNYGQQNNQDKNISSNTFNINSNNTLITKDGIRSSSSSESSSDNTSSYYQTSSYLKSRQGVKIRRSLFETNPERLQIQYLNMKKQDNAEIESPKFKQGTLSTKISPDNQPKNQKKQTNSKLEVSNGYLGKSQLISPSMPNLDHNEQDDDSQKSPKKQSKRKIKHKKTHEEMKLELQKQQKQEKQNFLLKLFQENKNNQFALFKIKINILIKQFVKVLNKNFNYKKQLSQRTIYHHRVQNDKTNEIDRVRNKNETTLDTLLFYVNKFPVFQPSNSICVIWNISILIITFLQFLFIPIKIAFQMKIKDLNETFLYILPVIYSFINIIICSNMGFYKHGQVITNKLQIVKNYYRAEFWYDFIPTISLILTEEEDFSFIYVVYFEILRIFQLRKLVGKVEFHFNLYEKYTTTTMLIKLLFIILSIAHYTGCGFIYVGRIQNDSDQSWIYSYSSKQSFYQYLDAFYFSVITMSTVGYGDINPQTYVEKIYVIITTIISCGVFAYAIQTVGTIFQASEMKQGKIRSERFQLLTYLQQKKIKSQLQLQALNYLNFVHEIEINNEYNQGKQILLTKISKNIRDDIMLNNNNYTKLIAQEPFFIDNFSEKFLQNLAVKFQEAKYGPGESILDMNEDNDKVFFVRQGEIEVQFKRENEIEYKLNTPYYLYKGPTIQQNEIFGINSLFKDEKAKYNVISKSISQIVHFTRQQFMETLQEFQNDWEIFMDIKEQFMIGLQNYDKCFFCKGYNQPICVNHSTQQCYMTQYTPNKNLIISRHNFSETQNRLPIYRPKPFQNNSLIHINNIRNTLKIFRIHKIIDPNSPLLAENYYQKDSTDKYNKFSKMIYEKAEKMTDEQFFFTFPIYQVDSQEKNQKFLEQFDFNNSKNQQTSEQNKDACTENDQDQIPIRSKFEVFQQYLQQYQSSLQTSNLSLDNFQETQSLHSSECESEQNIGVNTHNQKKAFKNNPNKKTTTIELPKQSTNELPPININNNSSTHNNSENASLTNIQPQNQNNQNLNINNNNNNNPNQLSYIIKPISCNQIENQSIIPSNFDFQQSQLNPTIQRSVIRKQSLEPNQNLGVDVQKFKRRPSAIDFGVSSRRPSILDQNQQRRPSTIEMTQQRRPSVMEFNQFFQEFNQKKMNLDIQNQGKPNSNDLVSQRRVSNLEMGLNINMFQQDLPGIQRKSGKKNSFIQDNENNQMLNALYPQQTSPLKKGDQKIILNNQILLQSESKKKDQQSKMSTRIKDLSGKLYVQFPNKDDVLIDSVQYIFSHYKKYSNYPRILENFYNNQKNQGLVGKSNIKHRSHVQQKRAMIRHKTIQKLSVSTATSSAIYGSLLQQHSNSLAVKVLSGRFTGEIIKFTDFRQDLLTVRKRFVPNNNNNPNNANNQQNSKNKDVNNSAFNNDSQDYINQLRKLKF